MTPLTYMKATYEAWAWKRVRIVALPLPPVQVHGLIYRPDSFASNTFDKEFDMGESCGSHTDKFRAVDVVPSPSGPAIIISLRLGNLISFDNTEGTLTVLRDSCCATVTYQTKLGLKIDGGVGRADHAINVSLKHLNFSSSCNPGSHIVVPDAPYLSALLQYAGSPSEFGDRERHQIIKNLSFYRPDEAKALFPGFDFSPNQAIDRYIASCAVNPDVKFYHTSSGIGEWVIKYLRQMRLNRLAMLDAPSWDVLSMDGQIPTGS